MTISQSTLSANAARSEGGGIYNEGTLTVSGCTLSTNSAGQGGGIDNAYTLTVSGCILSGNSAGDGGGLYNDGSGTLTLSGCTLSSNSAAYGGGIDNWGTLNVTGGSTVSGNSATYDGGGLFNRKSGRLKIQSSVVTNNNAPLGADLYNLGKVKISKDSTVGVIGP
jgi:hypothetical protein